MSHRSPSRRSYVLSSLASLAFLAFLALAVPGRALAAAPGSFEAGNAAAAAGDHERAAAAFEEAIRRHGWSANALLALGNAYDGAGQHGRAILAFERARLLAPRDGAIASNLAHVRASAGVTAPEPSTLERTVGRLSADEWTWIAVAGGLLACLGLVGLAWSFARPKSRLCLIAGTLVAAAGAAAAVQVAPARDRAVVVVGETARIAPFAAAEAAFTAGAGAAVSVEQERGDFVYVRDGERTGWLPRRAVERLVPDA